MKQIAFFIILLLPQIIYSQQKVDIYNPEADARKELSDAVKLAREQNKHVLVQVGGNWCSWCVRLHSYFKTNAPIDSILTADYVLLRINYSPENKNPEVLASLGYPQRFGFPVLLVVDANGQRLHTQDTGLLESGKGYDYDKVKRFLLEWNVAALNPDNYSDKNN